MSGLVRAAALLCTVMGLLAAGGVLAVTRDVRQALPVLLEFLTAAGLLRLGTARGWQALAAAAAIVLVRRLLVVGLRTRPAAG